MNGMEMMLSRMIGKTPTELKDMADKISSIVIAAGNDMEEIKSMCKDIITRLEALENAHDQPNADANANDVALLDNTGRGGNNGKRGKSTERGNSVSL